MSDTDALRQALPGAWQLVTYEIDDGSGEIIDRPFGEYPLGTLVYTAAGHVSVHAMAAGRERCETARPVECADALKLAAYDSYFGYVGIWTLDGEVVTHHVETSCFPDWNGIGLRRTVTVDGDVLVLRGVGSHPPDPLHPPLPRIPVLTWRRDPRSPQCTQP